METKPLSEINSPEMKVLFCAPGDKKRKSGGHLTNAEASSMLPVEFQGQGFPHNIAPRAQLSTAGEAGWDTFPEVAWPLSADDLGRLWSSRTSLILNL